MLTQIKKLSKATGHLRELVELLHRLWCEDAKGFEALLIQSHTSWANNYMIPCALRTLITERNDGKLREVLRRVCDSSSAPFDQKHLFYFVSALWGDEWAQQFERDYLDREVQRVSRSGSGLSSLLLALRCGAMLGQYSERADLERLQSCLAKKGEGKSECIAMVEALLEFHQAGFEGLTRRLRLAAEGNKVSHFEVKACFVLGAACKSEYAPLFLELFQRVSRNDWWSKNLRNRALSSLGYCTALGHTTLAAVEQHLARYRMKMASWWFGDRWTADLIAICAVLWNRGRPLGQTVEEDLRCIAAGSYKCNAEYAIALLTLKNLQLPEGARFSKEDYCVRFSVDALQYDAVLNFSYYWRCKQSNIGQ